MPRAERSLIDFDEATEIVPSRGAMTKANRSSLSVMVQIRKLQCEVMTTTQFPTSIDKQMLQQLDLYVLCDAWIPKDVRWNPSSARNAFVKLYVFDLWGQFTGNFMPSRYFPPPLWMAMKVLYLRNLPAAWNSYNTRQLVVSAHASEEVKSRLISRSWDLDEIERIEEEATARVLEENPAEREFAEAVEARFQEAREKPAPPPPSEHISLTPTTVEAWLQGKRMAQRFRVTNLDVKVLQGYGVKVENMKGVLELFQANGFETERKDGGWWAEVAG